jgi:hypothetical protein
MKDKYKDAKTYMEKYHHKETELIILTEELGHSKSALHEAKEHLRDHEMKIQGPNDKIEHLETQLE